MRRREEGRERRRGGRGEGQRQRQTYCIQHFLTSKSTQKSSHLCADKSKMSRASPTSFTKSDPVTQQLYCYSRKNQLKEALFGVNDKSLRMQQSPEILSRNSQLLGNITPTHHEPLPSLNIFNIRLPRDHVI